MVTIGINYLGYAGHDSSAALAIDGKIVYAIAEERLTRRKQDSTFPINAIRNCLTHGKLQVEEVDEWVFGWPPLQKFHVSNIRLILKQQLKDNLPAEILHYYRSLTTRSVKQHFRRLKIVPKKLTFINHHFAHALSVLPYLKNERSIIFIIDGRGVKESTSVYIKTGPKLELVKRINFPNSFGVFYSEITALCGFVKHSDEWKVMGLAPYGKKNFDLSEFIEVEKGSCKIDFNKLMNAQELVVNGVRITKRESDIESIDDEQIKDLAFSAQYYYELAILKFVKYYVDKYGIKSIGIAGGVGLNCKANGFLARELRLEEIFLQPAATDDGTALGAALYPFYQNGTIVCGDFNANLGNEYSNEEIKKILDKYNLRYEYVENVEADAAMELSKGNVLGWFQGRDEFGPRALGNRSILSDPRTVEMKHRVNEIVKYRENWRPFAPSLLVEKAGCVLKNIRVSPFMILTDFVTDEFEDKIPAVVHVDKTLRPQTVDKQTNCRYWNLINEFYKLTGVPVVMNTSFNLKGEPNVSNPTDAIRTFFSSGLNFLYLGNYKIPKNY